MNTVLANARMFDGVSEEFADGVSVVVENDRIREIAGREPTFQAGGPCQVRRENVPQVLLVEPQCLRTGCSSARSSTRSRWKATRSPPWVSTTRSTILPASSNGSTRVQWRWLGRRPSTHYSRETYVSDGDVEP